MKEYIENNEELKTAIQERKAEMKEERKRRREERKGRFMFVVLDLVGWCFCYLFGSWRCEC